MRISSAAVCMRVSVQAANKHDVEKVKQHKAGKEAAEEHYEEKAEETAKQHQEGKEHEAGKEQAKHQIEKKPLPTYSDKKSESD